MPMGLHQEDIDRLLEPEFIADLDTVPVADLRLRRDECQRVEVALSYVRRVLQGELDLVAAELQARGEGVRGDARRLVDDLPSILAGTRSDSPVQQHFHEPRPTMAGVAEGWTEQKELALEDLVAELLIAEQQSDGTHQPVLPGANLGAFADEELQALATSLRGAETTVSQSRRALHDRIDQIQAAIVERYKGGGADADSLLT
jgi:anti-sigma-K factor RsiG